MKSLLSIILILIASITFAQQADDIIGKYRLPNNLDVEIYKSGQKYFGKIIALNNFRDGQIKDIENPDDSKHNDNLIGKIILKDLVFNTKDKQWFNGNIYSSEKGIIADFKVTDMRETEIEVVASKYVFWRTLEWKKI